MSNAPFYQLHNDTDYYRSYKYLPRKEFGQEIIREFLNKFLSAYATHLTNLH